MCVLLRCPENVGNHHRHAAVKLQPDVGRERFRQAQHQHQRNPEERPRRTTRRPSPRAGVSVIRLVVTAVNDDERRRGARLLHHAVLLSAAAVGGALQARDQPVHSAVPRVVDRLGLPLLRGEYDGELWRLRLRWRPFRCGGVRRARNVLHLDCVRRVHFLRRDYHRSDRVRDASRIQGASSHTRAAP